MKIRVGEAAERAWERLKARWEADDVGDLEEELRKALEDTGVEGATAYGFRRSMGMFRRMDRIEVGVEGSEEDAKTVVERLRRRIAGDGEVTWVLDVTLRPVPVPSLIDKERAKRKAERAFIGMTIGAGIPAILLSVIVATRATPVTVALAWGVAAAAGFFVPWRAGFHGLVRDVLGGSKRLRVWAFLACTVVTALGLLSMVYAAKGGLLAVLVVAFVTGIVLSLAVTRVMRVLVRAV